MDVQEQNNGVLERGKLSDCCQTITMDEFGEAVCFVCEVPIRVFAFLWSLQVFPYLSQFISQKQPSTSSVKMAAPVITLSNTSSIISTQISKHSTPISSHETTTPSFPARLTKSRKVAIVTILILCNSLLVSPLTHSSPLQHNYQRKKFLSYGATIAGAFSIGLSFNVHDPTTASWIAASYPLTLGTFVLPAGRLGAVFGSKTILLIGGTAFILFSFINGFCMGSLVGFVVVRALSGVGAALVLPNVVGVIGELFGPGKRGRGVSFGMLGFGVSCSLSRCSIH
jgi:hypothetical protein